MKKHKRKKQENKAIKIIINTQKQNKEQHSKQKIQKETTDNKNMKL